MAPVTPFWFKQRQAKAEEAGPNLLRVSGPNLKEAFVGIRQGDGALWSAFLRTSADEPDIDAGDEEDEIDEAPVTPRRASEVGSPSPRAGTPARPPNWHRRF